MPIEISRRAVPSRSSRATESRKQSLRLPLRRQRFGAKDRMFLTDRLTLLIRTGVPLHASLELLARQAGNEGSKEIVRTLQHDVASGLSFSRALARHPEAFPPTYVNLIDAGERGGFLPQVLERLRAMDEKREELRSTLWAAFSYPAFLITFSIAVVLFVLTVVFPKFSELFETIRDQLPATTLFLMALSEGLRTHWVPGLVGITALAGLLGWWARRPRGALLLEGLLLRTPGIRNAMIQLQLVQFLYVMALSIANGVPMLDALRACRQIASGSWFRRFVETLETRVTQGLGISSGFGEADFLPVLVPQMIETAEESGSLAPVMGQVAEFYERQWKRQLTALAKLVEPLLLLVMGVVVGVIVASLILPIFKVARAVR